jgi:hypothetical protein
MTILFPGLYLASAGLFFCSLSLFRRHGYELAKDDEESPLMTPGRAGGPTVASDVM